MADWLTHILLAWTAIEIISLRYPKIEDYRIFALVGAVLPDIGNFTMFLGESGAQLSSYFFPLHAPLGIILLIIPISLAMKKEEKTIFYLLTFGAMLHITTDFFITTLTGKVPLLFPFSFELYGINIFLQGGWNFLIMAIILAITSTVTKRVYKNLQNSN